MNETPNVRQRDRSRQRQHHPDLDVELEQGVHPAPLAALQMVLEIDELDADQHQQRGEDQDRQKRTLVGAGTPPKQGKRRQQWQQQGRRHVPTGQPQSGRRQHADANRRAGPRTEVRCQFHHLRQLAEPVHSQPQPAQ